MPDSQQQRRETILQAAAKVFDRCGYAAATMDAVAAEAGVSKGSIYNYFRNKHDLFMCVFLAAFAEDRSEIEAMLAGTDSAREQIDLLLERLQERLDEYRSIGRLLLEFWAHAAREDREGDFSQTLQQMGRQWQQMFADVIARGIASGEFAESINPMLAAQVFQALIDGIITHAILRTGMDLTPEFFASLRRSVLSVLASGTLSAPAETTTESTTQDAN